MWRRDISLGTDGAVIKSSVREEKEARLLLNSLHFLAFLLAGEHSRPFLRKIPSAKKVRTCARENLVAKNK